MNAGPGLLSFRRPDITINALYFRIEMGEEMQCANIKGISIGSIARGTKTFLSARVSAELPDRQYEEHHAESDKPSPCQAARPARFDLSPVSKAHLLV